MPYTKTAASLESDHPTQALPDVPNTLATIGLGHALRAGLRFATVADTAALPEATITRAWTIAETPTGLSTVVALTDGPIGQPVQPLPQGGVDAMQLRTPYAVIDDAVDWSTGHVALVMAVKNQGLSNSAYVERLKRHVNLVVGLFESKGLDGYLVYAGEDHEWAYLHWPDEATAQRAFSTTEGATGPQDAKSIQRAIDRSPLDQDGLRRDAPDAPAAGSVLSDALWSPEGPVWLPNGDLLVVEMRRKTLTRIARDGSTTMVAQLGGSPNGAALGEDGHIYVCNSGGFSFVRNDAGQLLVHGQPEDYSGGRIERVNPETGETTLLYREVNGHTLRGPNDIVMDEHGGFWFTDLGKVRSRDMDRGGVYYARLDGSLIEEVIFPLLTPNGIALSPDGRTLYVTETMSARLLAFEIESPGRLKAGGDVGGKTCRCVYVAPDFVKFDSMAVEASGNICLAVLFHGSITTVSPQGKVVEVHPVDDVRTTNICFGGPDMRQAFITLAASGVLMQVDWPRPGLRLNGYPSAS